MGCSTNLRGSIREPCVIPDDVPSIQSGLHTVSSTDLGSTNLSARTAGDGVIRMRVLGSVSSPVDNQMLLFFVVVLVVIDAACSAARSRLVNTHVQCCCVMMCSPTLSAELSLPKPKHHSCCYRSYSMSLPDMSWWQGRT